MNPDTDPNYDNRLHEKIQELMKKGGDYYPFEHSNFVEFLAKMDDSIANNIADLIDNHSLEKNYMGNVGVHLAFSAYAYWERLATTEAKDRLQDEYNSCERCGGTGCSKCEKDNDN